MVKFTKDVAHTTYLCAVACVSYSLIAGLCAGIYHGSKYLKEKYSIVKK